MRKQNCYLKHYWDCNNTLNNNSLFAFVAYEFLKQTFENGCNFWTVERGSNYQILVIESHSISIDMTFIQYLLHFDLLISFWESNSNK
jgi:hypothetical protein